MLEIVNLSVSYGGHVVLRDLNLVVPSGTTTAIIGASGTGKSTLLHAVCGVVGIDEGRILVDGTDITAHPVHRRPLGLVSQTGDLFPTMTVRDNIEFGLRMDGIPAPERHARCRELLSMIGMDDFGARMPATLSGGQARRVALARALARKPPVLLLDEPLTGLDPAIHDELAGDLKQLLEDLDTTVVLVTHDPEEARFLADTVVDVTSLSSRP